MNISITRLKPTVRTLREIKTELGRIADSLEVICAEQYGIRKKAPPQAPESAEPDLMEYDEEKEFLERIKSLKLPAEEE